MNWWRWVMIVSILALILDGINAAWGKHRPLADFFEQIIAEVLYYGHIFGTLAIAIWLGTLIYSRTQKSWLAWLSGLTMWLLLVVSATSLIDLIPGVNWRVNLLMENTSYGDY